MISPKFILDQFAASFANVQIYTQKMSHHDSIWQPPFGGNSVNWVMGHLVVSRCNFLMLLDVPSIWTMDQCRRFIPGSKPVTGDADAVPFNQLMADFARTQELLVEALNRVTDEELAEVKGEMTVAESLVYYLAHESQHVGQLEILCVLARF